MDEYFYKIEQKTQTQTLQYVWLCFYVKYRQNYYMVIEFRTVVIS